MFKHPFFVLLALTVALSLALAACARAAAPTEAPAAAPAATLAPPTAAPATDTPMPPATATTAPTVAPTAMSLPQTWNGTYKQAGYATVPISVLIEKMTGDSFTGKMVWGAGPNYKGAITRITGQFVKDFGDATEQAKWDNVADYKSGDKSGTWITWTETAMVQGSGYTLGGWYYGHILDNGTATGIYYLNDKVTSFSTGDAWNLKTK